MSIKKLNTIHSTRSAPIVSILTVLSGGISGALLALLLIGCAALDGPEARTAAIEAAAGRLAQECESLDVAERVACLEAVNTAKGYALSKTVNTAPGLEQ